MLFTHIARMYRNTVRMRRGDRSNFQSDVSIFRAKNSAFSGNYLREAVLFVSGSENVEKCSSEKLFEENDMKFLSAT